MRKSTVVATCLVKSGFTSDIESAEVTVKGIFENEFPDQDFHKWNTVIPKMAAQQIIDGAGGASRINVKKCIEALWKTVP